MLPPPLIQAAPLLALTDDHPAPNGISHGSQASNQIAPSSKEEEPIPEKDEPKEKEKVKHEPPAVSSTSERVAVKDVIAAGKELMEAIKSRGASGPLKRPAAAKVKPTKVKVQKQSATKEAKAKTKAKKNTGKASISHEASRNQFMCRTGSSGPGQCFAIKYSKKKGDLEKAKKQAQKWLSDQR
jgi:hypothetical protein